MEAIENINTRRSVRSFEEDEVPPSQIAEILRCGLRAPSASNGRPWEFILVKDQNVKDRIGYLGARSLYERKKRRLKDTKEQFEKIAEAPLFIVVACNTKKSPIFWRHDGSAATQNILLAAHSLGLGAVWVGAPFALKKHSNEIKKLLGMPKHIEIASIVALGSPKIKPKLKQVTDLKKKIHYERW
ncbi:MAG: nitroreductase family protein [Thermoplasmata archaeon]|nr:MAG: nitroreductase family protein [Thermoplasmata archaeon]